LRADQHARDLGLSKNTVMAIVHRHRAANVPPLSHDTPNRAFN
jgi:hypothetical protein